MEKENHQSEQDRAYDEMASFFKDSVIMEGEIALYRPADALKVIEIYRERGVAIAGFEAVELLEGGRFRPSMEHSCFIDPVVRIPSKEETWETAEAIVRKYSDLDITFDISGWYDYDSYIR